MGSYPSFGVLLTRLMDHRRLDVSVLSAASGIPEVDLGSLASGVPPLAWQIVALASGAWHPCRRPLCDRRRSAAACTSAPPGSGSRVHRR